MQLKRFPSIMTALAFAAFGVMALNALPAQAVVDCGIKTVQPGDTIFSVMKSVGADWENPLEVWWFAQANPNRGNPNVMKEGQIVNTCHPKSGQFRQAVATGFSPHRVQKGENLAQLLAANGFSLDNSVTVWRTAQANLGLVDPNSLKEGSVIYIPVRQAKSAAVVVPPQATPPSPAPPAPVPSPPVPAAPLPPPVAPVVPPAPAKKDEPAGAPPPLANGLTDEEIRRTHHAVKQAVGSTNQYIPTIRRVLKWDPAIRQAADAVDLQPSLLFAVVSRETRGHNVIGDGGHGRGLGQIDDRFIDPDQLEAHQDGLDPTWNAAEMAKRLRAYIKAFNGDVRKGVAAYNAGVGGVKRVVARGLDPDMATTGHDYSRDVLKRAAEFHALGVDDVQP